MAFFRFLFLSPRCASSRVLPVDYPCLRWKRVFVAGTATALGLFSAFYLYVLLLPVVLRRRPFVA